MPSLQIRNLPEDLYQALSFRAEQAHRSLAQQALIDLRKSTEGANSGQRERILASISDDIMRQGTQTLRTLPEALIREDRER